MSGRAPDGNRRLRRWHGYATAQLAALFAWFVGASAPGMHSGEDSSLLVPMLDWALGLTLALIFLPAILAGVADAVVLGRAGGRPSVEWVGLLVGFGLLGGYLAISAIRLMVDFDVSDGYAFHRLTWLGSILGMELGLGLELLVGLASYPSFLRGGG